MDDELDEIEVCRMIREELAWEKEQWRRDILAQWGGTSHAEKLGGSES